MRSPFTFAKSRALRVQRAFLERVAPSKRRTALRALADVVPEAEMPALQRLVPAASRRG